MASERWHDIAQICLNGHITNSSTGKHPQHNQKFCKLCGAESITKCKQCNAPIRGYYYTPGLYASYDRPGFCIECGKPYPWTEEKIKAAREMVDEIDEWDDDEKAKVKSSIEEIISENPRTELGAIRIKKALANAGKGLAIGLKNIFVDIAAETAKKILQSP